jgi:hypothetical protein
MGSTKTKEIVIKTKKSKVGGSSKKGRQSAVHVRKYQRQFDRTAKNKEKAWNKHLKIHPNDLVAKELITKRGFILNYEKI